MEGDLNMLGDIDPDANHFNDNSIQYNQYTIDTFSMCNLQNNDFNLFHHNSQSIMKEGRIDEYDLLFNPGGNPFQVMVFTETWLTNSNKDICNFNQFESEHLLRPIDHNFDFKLREVGFQFLLNKVLLIKGGLI